MGCHVGIKVVSGNGGSGRYLYPLDPNESIGGKEGRNRVCTSTENLVDIVLGSLEGGTAKHEGKVGCLIMVDNEKYGNYSGSENSYLLSGPDLEKYLLHLSSLNYKDWRLAQG